MHTYHPFCLCPPPCLPTGGATGPTGPTGPQGEPGPQGLPGPAGAAGPQGPAGAPGSTGPAGERGPTGPAGAAGSAGATGPTGPQGVPGAAGATGPAGEAGPQGIPGPTGPQGVPGRDGPTGPTGATGPQGSAGPGTDAFASFYSDVRTLPNGSAIPLYPLLADLTGAITPAADYQSLQLQPGCYLATFDVSAVLAAPGYLQVTPSVGGQAQVALGVYFRTAAGNASAGGSRTFAFCLPSGGVFSLTYNSSTSSSSVTTTVTLQRLRQAGA